MGLGIAAGVMGVVGLAGGIMGGMGKAQQQEAAFRKAEAERMEANFLNAMAHDRQTEATAQKNVNSKINDRKIYESAVQNKFYANYSNQKQTMDARAQVYQSARATQATAMSRATGQGISSSGSREAITRQQLSQERAQRMQVQRASTDKATQITNEFDYMLDTRNMGLGDAKTQAFIPGSAGIQPSSSGAMMEGILGGLGGGLGMASGVMGLKK